MPRRTGQLGHDAREGSNRRVAEQVQGARVPAGHNPVRCDDNTGLRQAVQHAVPLVARPKATVPRGNARARGVDHAITFIATAPPSDGGVPISNRTAYARREGFTHSSSRQSSVTFSLIMRAWRSSRACHTPFRVVDRGAGALECRGGSIDAPTYERSPAELRPRRENCLELG